jgi:GT2 family glycosyltransferase
VPYPIEIINDYERTVAGAWNHGIRQAMLKRADYFVVVSNDARPAPGSIEALLEFGHDPVNRNVALWSGIPVDQWEVVRAREERSSDGADFAFFCLRLETVDEFGWFDENFRPAYFEDNDYYARIVLGGKECHKLYGAPFQHLGSQTIKHDAEMAHHVKHWFEINRHYFASKWGVPQPKNDQNAVRASYFQSPFNSKKKLSYWRKPC